jgi:hypothetical protein
MPAKQRQAKVRRQSSDEDVNEIFRRLKSMPVRPRKAAPFLDQDRAMLAAGVSGAPG